jgi:hypothetical protein
MPVRCPVASNEVPSAVPLSRSVPNEHWGSAGVPSLPLLFCVWMDFLCRQVAAACESLGVRGYRVAYRIDGRLVEPPRCDKGGTAAHAALCG